MKRAVITVIGRPHPVEVSEADGRQIEAAWKRGVPVVTYGGQLSLATSSISSIEFVVRAATPDERPRLAAPTTEISDEQRERNLERVRQMRRDFLERRRVK